MFRSAHLFNPQHNVRLKQKSSKNKPLLAIQSDMIPQQRP